MQPQNPFSTAVLFMAFNRPKEASRVFQEIRNAKPPRLYVAIDGPRGHLAGETELVNETKENIINHVDWDCQLHTLIRPHNLGCKMAVSSAIDWFFQHEEMGIILEDDCLPEPSFFPFCETLLKRYFLDSRIGQVCGFNPLGRYNLNDHSYLYSRFGPIWGWASWRRAWKEYDVEMRLWRWMKQHNYLSSIGQTEKEINWRVKIFDQVSLGKIDTWDFQWSFTKCVNHMLSIIPSHNLINNIGFNEFATHTKKQIPEYKTYGLNEYIPPPIVIANRDFDNKYLNQFAWEKSSILSKLKKK